MQCLDVAELNAYDVLVNDWIVFTTDTLPGRGARRRPADSRPTVTPTRPALPPTTSEGAADDEEAAP